MPLMLGMGIILFASMISISQMFVLVGGPLIPDLLANMPTIFHYTEDGQRAPEYIPLLGNGTEGDLAEEFPAIAMYALMVKIAFGIFVVLLMLAGISYFFETFNIVRPGTAFEIIAKMVVFAPLYLVLPYLWDTMAFVIESSSLYLMDPFGGDPHGRTAEMWCKIGSVACSVGGSATIDPLEIFHGLDNFDRDNTLRQESWNNSLQDPIFGESFMINVLLSLFKGFAVLFMTAMMFVLSAIRILLIEVIVIAFPLISAIGLIPWINTKGISNMFQQNLIGLSIAPIMSAITLSIGLSTIDAQNMPPLRMWFQMLSIGFLAIFFPVLLSPMLGNLSTRVGNMVSQSITSTTMAGSAVAKNSIAGVSQASHLANIGHQKTSTGDSTIPSIEMGSATSGQSLSGLSAMDKFKMYGKAGTVGMLGGLGSGLLQSSAQRFGFGSAVTPTVGQMLHAGDGKIESIVGNTAISNISKMATKNMIQIEGADAAKSVPPVIMQSTVMNPGSSLDYMVQNDRFYSTGSSLATDPASQKEFARLYGKSHGMEMTSEMQKKMCSRMQDEIMHHPIAAAKMFNGLKPIEGDGQ